MSFFKLIENNFIPILLSGLIIGYLFPQFGNFAFASSFMLAVAIFLSSLKVDFNIFFEHLKDLKYIGKKFIVLKLIAPLLVFFASLFIVPEFALGGLLIVATPSGISNIILSDIFKGNNALALLFTIITHMLSPLLIPVLVFIAVSQTVAFDYFGLFSSLILMVVLPVIVAYLISRRFPEKVEKIKHTLSGTNIVLIWAIIIVVIGQNANNIGDLSDFIIPVIYVFAIMLVMTAIALTLARKESKENKIAIGLSGFHANAILGLIIATTYFPFEVVSVMIAYQIVLDPYFAVYKKIVDVFI
ncbi:MAG: bile acid:sodium symporter [Candidatus Diapherotrites archaeon]